MRKRALKRLFISFASCALSLFCQSSFAQNWTVLGDIASTTNNNLTQPGVTRTPDGVAHVVAKVVTPLTASFRYHTVSPDGVVSPGVDILSGWTSATNPSLVALPDGRLRVFFGGIRTTDVSDPFSGGSLYSITSDTSRTSWTLDTTPYTPQTSIYAATSIGSTVDSSGTQYVSWTGGAASLTVLKVGDREVRTDLGGCCSYYGNVAIDPSTGGVIGGLYSNVTNLSGLYYQQLFPTEGARFYAPGSSENDEQKSASSVDAVTPLVSGSGGAYAGYCAGYPFCNEVRVVRIGSSSYVSIPRTRRADEVGIAKGPNGKVWVLWRLGSKMFAARSNSGVSTFSTPSQVKVPAGSDSYFRAFGEGSSGPLDLFLVSNGTEGIATRHTRLLPTLTLKSSRRSIRAGSNSRLTFTVLDAGEAVSGAVVRFSGKKGTSDASGKVKLNVNLRRRGKAKATAAAAGYSNGSLSLVGH